MIAPHAYIAVVEDDATYRTIGYDFDATIQERGHEVAAVFDHYFARITARREYAIVTYTDRPDPVKIVSDPQHIIETRDAYPDARGQFRWNTPTSKEALQAAVAVFAREIGERAEIAAWIEHPSLGDL